MSHLDYHHTLTNLIVSGLPSFNPFSTLTKTLVSKTIWLLAQNKDRNKFYTWEQENWLKFCIENSTITSKPLKIHGRIQPPPPNQGVLLQRNSPRSLKSGTEGSPSIIVGDQHINPKQSHQVLPITSLPSVSTGFILEYKQKAKTTEHLQEDYKI